MNKINYLIANKPIALFLAGFIMLGMTACSEKDYPEEVASGVARLSVNNFARLLEGVRALRVNPLKPECNFNEFKLVEGKTTVIQDSNGYGSVTVAFEGCEFDFASGKTIESKGSCKGQKTTFSGKVKVSGTRTMSGLITGDSTYPVIPSGSENSMDVVFSKVDFENYKVKSSDRNEAMTIKSGSAAFKMRVHLAQKNCELNLCVVPLPNPTLTEIRYLSKSVVRVPGPRGEFEAEINSSNFNAQIGIHKDVSNRLDGTMTLWGSTVKVPKDDSVLDPNFNAESYKKSLACNTDLKKPIEEQCSYEQEIAEGVARLTVHNMGNLFYKLVANDHPSVDQRPECYLGRRSLDKPPTEIHPTDAKHADGVWKFNECIYDFGNDPKAPLLGKVMVSGARIVHGRQTPSKVFPIEPTTSDVTFQVTSVRVLEGFHVGRPLPSLPTLKHASGELAFEVVLHMKTKTIADKEVPERGLSNLTFKNIKYLGKNELILSRKLENVDGKLKLVVEDAELKAQLLKHEDRENLIEGKLKIFGKWLDLIDKDLVPKRDYVPGQTEYFPEVVQPSPKPGQPKPVQPKEELPSTYEKDVRAFFADLLVPPRGGKHATKLEQFRATLVEHSTILYWIIRQPDLLSKSGVPVELETWIRPFGEHLKDVSSELFKEALIAASDEDVSKYIGSVEKGITNFEIKGFEGLMQIKIPEALGSYFSRFLKNVIAEYFPQLGRVDKKRIFASLLRNTSTKSSEIDRLMAIVYASGPFFQKLMQLLGDKLEKGPLKTALSTVKSKLPSIDPYDIEKYLKELADIGIRLEIVRSLGAASVGETFLANQTLESGEVRLIAIKFMRPGIEPIARRENAFFSKQAALISDTMKISFRQISKQIFDELDLRTELRNLELGANVYNSNEPNATGFAANIVAVRPIKGFPQTKFWMAMEFGNGKAVRDTRGIVGDSKMSLRRAKLELTVKGILLDTLTRKFIRKALFREPRGFFHGDLHEGNMIIWIHPDVEDLMDKANLTGESLTRKDVESLLGKKDKFGEPLIKLILIDFGNSHELSESDRLALFNLVISISDISLSPNAFLIALQQLSHGKQTLDMEALLEKITPIFGDDAMKFSDKIGKSIDVLQQNDIFVPGLFVAFYRSIDLVGNSYRQLREDATEQDFCFDKLKMEDALTGEIVWRILDKLPYTDWPCHINNILMPASLHMDCTWPDILSPENVKAMKPRMPVYARAFFGDDLGNLTSGVNTHNQPEEKTDAGSCLMVY